MQITQIINSSVGVSGNVGLRTGHVIDEALSRGHECTLFSRYSDHRFRKISKGFNSYMVLSKALNSVRIYGLRSFDSRRWDNYGFSLLERLFHKREVSAYPNNKKILHLWEYLPDLMQRYINDQYYIYLDVPIAPALYSEYLNDNYGELYPYKVNPKRITMEKRCFALADKIIVPSEFVRNVLKDFYNVPEGKMVLIPFGTDNILGANNATSQKTLPKKSGLDFCFAGVINMRKGISTLLDAWNDPLFSEDRLHLCGRLFPINVRFYTE